MIKIFDSGLKNESGNMLVSVLVITVVLVLIGFSLASLSLNQFYLSNGRVFSANALLVAEAGVEHAIQSINENEGFSGEPTEQVFFDNSDQGKGTYTTVVNELGSSSAKEIISTGRVYRQNSDEVESSREVKVTIVGTTSNGYSVHTGPGGLILGGSANITNSDIFVNGLLTLTGSSKIGTFSQPLNIDVAHQSCPTGNNPGPTYPQVCSSGSGQPISTAYSTAIYGTVCATNQTSTNYPSGNPAGNILPGSTGEGLKLGCVADPVQPPTYNRAAHIAGIGTTSGINNNYLCQKSPFTRTWPANGIRFNGNVDIAKSCDITINGNAYITGDLSIGGNATIRVSDSVGSNRPVVVVDGSIETGGSAQMLANSSGTGIEFISFDTNAACRPDCTNLSGNELKNSQGYETISINGAVNLPGMIFQAYWGLIKIGGSGSIGAAAGQTVDMSGSGTITFGTELSSGVRSWNVTSYQQDYPD